MDKLINKENFLYKYLILELFEKLYRLEKYINTCKKYDKKNNDDRILQLFYNAIEIIGNDINNEVCSEITEGINDDEKLAILLKINQNSKAISKIHEELKNLHSSWILPEIKTFTNEITKENIQSQKDIYIILSDNYSFLERNLGKKFETVLKEVYGQSETSELKENHSFILPKIEFSNPLNWTIIVLEAGHLQSDTIAKIRNNPIIMPVNIQSFEEKTIKNWAEEIYCDIYAISVLGPAYFISFVSFALISPLDYGISSNSELHPSVILRATIMFNYLIDNNLRFKSEWGIDDYCKIFYNSLINQKTIFNDQPKNNIEGLTTFNRNLRKLIKDLELSEFTIEEADSKRIQGLLDSLKNGIPIGSVCVNNGVDWKELMSKENLEKDDIEKLKNSVSERSCKIWEILNAGWLYKLEHNCVLGEEIFFNAECEHKDIMTKIDKYGEAIDFLDDRLLASINTSQIINIIEN
jgi:hypothetical protein